MAVKDMAQDSSMVPHLPVKPVHRVVVVVAGASRVAGVVQVNSSGAATMANSHGVALVTVLAVGRGGKLFLLVSKCSLTVHIQ